ncbi:hypothetical protein [Actinoplanes sp. L3-i22]|uniref:hypothetical protein n=1 Tax=Actinoplanes sp. L3-i22 TaxID=2836373 RepID=UPI001C782E70|nr:hypothetical protein [Actinoplanes sp. L3-i22]BCY13541.1 hypothetical protein L3i22_086290 [Actinoplanes sp. L3-i22]
MSKLLLSLAAVVVGVAGTAGAAIATEPVPQVTAASAAPAAALPAVTPAAVVQKAKVKRAVAVVVVRTRSGQVGQSVFTLVGSSSKEEADILRLASTPAFWSLRPKYAPASTKGRYTYRVEAGYQDKTKKRVIVVEGAPGTPQVALDVIQRMTNLSTPDVSVNFPPGFPFN